MPQTPPAFLSPLTGSLTATTTTLASSLNPAAAGQAVTLTATLTPSGATGTVTFRDVGIGANLGTGTLSGGTAMLTTTALAVGLRSIVAVYSGDSSHAASGSATLLQEIIPATANTFVAASGSPFPAGSKPYSIGVGDFNGDGKLDMAVANSGTNYVTILLGDGAGNFTQASVTVIFGPLSIAVGDFNGDGKLDLAAATSINTITVLLGDGTGKFSTAPGSPFSSGISPFSIVTGDFNGDGKLDLAVSDASGNGVTVLLGDGTGSFSPSSGSPFAAGGFPLSVATADLNGDGKLDLVVTNSSDNTATVLLGDGTGNFAQASGSPVAAGNFPQFAVIGDFNGDGKLDMAVADTVGNNVTILLGDGTGKFAQAGGSPVGVGSSPVSIALGDFNGDGKLDLAVSNNSGNSVTLLLGDGAGKFAPAGGSPFGTGQAPFGLVAADFNGDGRLDLAIPNYSGNTVTVLLGLQTTTTSVSSSVNPSNSGQAVSFSGTITPSTATGSVQFVVDGVNSGSPVTVSGGIAISASTTTLSIGNHTVTANFTGSGGYVSSSATLSGGQTVNSVATLAQLGIASSHIGGFTQGQNGATYTLTVSNAASAPSTTGTVTVTETAPTGLTLVSLAGTGWTCAGGGNTCTRSDALAGGASYPAITATVNVASNAAALVVNTVSVTWSGTEIATAWDDTVINQLTGLQFVPLTPCRIADTRKSTFPAGFGTPAISGGTTRDFVISDSSCGIPNSALGYSLNVAVVPSGPLGFITVWPAGQPQPVTATLNSTDGRVKSNAAIVPAGTGGAISVFATNTTDVVLDINGYFVPAGTSGALAFYPMTPCRIADTRKFTGPLGTPALVGGASRTFPILSSTCNVPSAAQAYSLNLAAVPPGPLGFITAFPTGQARPTAATLNDSTGTVVSNAAIVPAGTSGSIDVYASNNTNLVMDIDGYFATPGTGGLSLYTVLPCRVLDSRKPPGTPPFSGEKDVVVNGTCGAVPAAQAYVFNATVVPPEALGFLTLWPQGQTQPTTATLNASDGAITNNMAIVKTTNGSISAFGSNSTQLILDLFGFFAQ